jgi:nucleoside phosphorylase
MLIWVCALHCEAKPVIDFYRLKKSHDDNSFDLYRGDNMACIISGMGKLASAAASAWIAARYEDAASIAWINLGIAGAASYELGSIFALNQVIDADTGQRFYPAPGADSALPGCACLTLGQPSEEYRDKQLYDMEASGFMHSALRFSSAELTQSIKVVSDNQRHKTGADRPRISALIHRHIELIDRQANALVALNQEIAALEIPAESWQQLNAMAHFSQTQKSRLRVLWRYLMNRDLSSEQLFNKIATCASSKAIIEVLEQLSYQQSEGL